jgi:hypothetical protein
VPHAGAIFVIPICIQPSQRERKLGLFGMLMKLFGVAAYLRRIATAGGLIVLAAGGTSTG